MTAKKFQLVHGKRVSNRASGSRVKGSSGVGSLQRRSGSTPELKLGRALVRMAQEADPRRGRRPGWQASTLYIGDADDSALQAYCNATGEKMAPVIRRAIREYLNREAKKVGTTSQALAAQR